MTQGLNVLYGLFPRSRRAAQPGDGFRAGMLDYVRSTHTKLFFFLDSDDLHFYITKLTITDHPLSLL